MMAHVRYATKGGASLENVHPFSRELWGIHWCFCHNGEVPKFCDWVKDEPRLGKTVDIMYRPIGDTDSEAVFCAILNALKAEFEEVPTLPVLHCFLRKLCDEIIEGHTDDSIFNFLLGCGQYTLFAYSWPGRRQGSTVWNGLHYIVREPPFKTAKLVDDDYTIDFSTCTTPSDRIAVITTKPLTSEEGWHEFKRGQLLMFDNGLPYSTSESCAKVEALGRGLYSKCFGKGCPIQRAAMVSKLQAAANTVAIESVPTTTCCTRSDTNVSETPTVASSSESEYFCEDLQEDQTKSDITLTAENAVAAQVTAAAIVVASASAACLDVPSTRAKQSAKSPLVNSRGPSPVSTATRIIGC